MALCVLPSSSRMMLPSSRPLRTGQDDFSVIRLKPFSTPFFVRGTRFRYGETLAVNLLMAGRMKQDTIFLRVWSPFGPPVYVMAMPSRTLRDLLLADRTFTVLFLPEMVEPLFPFVGCHHLSVKALFKVAFPCRVK